MTTDHRLPRVGAICGALFAAGVFAGSSAHLHVVALAAFALFLPFLAYVYSLLRAVEGENGWLSTTALASGIAGITIKLGSIAPAIALQRGVAHGTPLYKAIDNISGAGTLLSLWPLAVLCAAVAALALRTGVLPRWLGVGTAVTAIALAVNGTFINADFVPALLLFLLWTLVTSLVLYRRGAGEPTKVARTYSPAIG